MPTLLPHRCNWMRIALALSGTILGSNAWAEIPREGDLTMAGLRLNDVQSAKTPFNMQPALDDPNNDRPKAYVCNADNSERLTLVYYEGDTAYVISEFHVEQVATRYVDCNQPGTSVEHFVSGKGIALGMEQGSLVSLLGTPHHQHPQLDETVLVYRIDDKNGSDFLQHHSAPAYFGQYHFRQNRLVKFSFGFDFP